MKTNRQQHHRNSLETVNISCFNTRLYQRVIQIDAVHVTLNYIQRNSTIHALNKFLTDKVRKKNVTNRILKY